jgi:putative ABC transport system permease protein
MRVIRILRQRLESLFRRKRAEAQLNRELSLHLEQLIRENIARGMSESEARFEARREFGPVALIEEACRDTRRVDWIEDRWRDLQYAFRQMRHEKAFATLAILTLALGIGAVTIIFSIVDTVLLKPLAYKDPGRLYAASESAPELARVYPRLPVNASHFRSWEEQCQSCESATLLNPASFNLTGRGEAEVVDGATCTWPLFHVLGVAPQLGRTFERSDDQPGGNRFVVISDSLWRRRFAADPAAIGKPIQIDGEPNIVIGVLRPDFRFPSGEKLGPLNQFPKHAEIFKPMGFDWQKLGRVGQFNFASLIRLRPGANAARAEAEMTAAIADAGHEMKTPLSAHLTPLQEQVTGRSRRALLLLFAAVGAILLIVCVNLGNLMLVRANERARDAAICRALGANSSQLFRRALTESLLIALSGGALGLLLAHGGIQILVRTSPIDIPRLDEVRINLTVLVFAFSVSALCGIVCGLWPAIRATRVEPADALRCSSRSTTQDRGGLRSREWLVGVEVALSTVLLAVAALLGLSFFRITHVERGYVVDRVLAGDVTLPRSRYQTDKQRILLHQRALEAMESIPGVRSAGLISSLPLKTQAWGDAINQKGDTRPRIERPMAQYRFVSEHYFQTMGIALLQGRFPNSSDRGHKVAVISESAARKVWPGENAIGKLIRNDPKSEWVEIIGVVADVRTESLEKQPPVMVYVPYWDGAYWQGYVWGNATYVVRTAQDPAAMANALRVTIHKLDPELPLANVLTMREILSESIGSRKFQTLLTALFASAALLLACIGIYGVISYSVMRRRNEIGIRMAIGAKPRQVSLAVFRQGIRPVIGGLLVGAAGALASGRLIDSFLFGTQARDPAALFAAIGILFTVAALACWGPARRASRIDPAVALRNE